MIESPMSFMPPCDNMVTIQGLAQWTPMQIHSIVWHFKVLIHINLPHPAITPIRPQLGYGSIHFSQMLDDANLEIMSTPTYEIVRACNPPAGSNHQDRTFTKINFYCLSYRKLTTGRACVFITQNTPLQPQHP